jgi:hypothetical protein
MGILRLGAMILLISVLSFTLPVQVCLATVGYLRIVDVTAPESALVGEVMALSVSVEWSSLYTFKIWGDPVVRVEICEGTNVATCKALAFAPSENGEPIRGADVRPTGSKTYSIEVRAPEQAGIWHLMAIFEIAASRVGATLNAVWRGVWAVVPSGGYDPWQEFDVVVKPNETALLTSRTLFTESFELGLGGWKVEGVVSTVDKNPVLLGGPEGHSGRFAALLGIDWSEGILKGNPSNAGYAYEFSLQREIAVTAGSDLTVTFWYRGVYPVYVHDYGMLPNMFLTFSVDSPVGRLDEVTIHADGLAEDWQSVTRSMFVPAQTSSVVLGYYGRGEIVQGGPAGGIELDDILASERTFSLTYLPPSTTTLVSTTTSQKETKASQTLVSTSSVKTESSTLSLPMAFLQTSWPYLVATLLVVAVVAVLLARKRTGRSAPTPETKGRETIPGGKEAYCYYCGAPMPTDAQFCRECGKAQEPGRG